MTARGGLLLLVLLAVTASIGIGAATPSTGFESASGLDTRANANASAPMGTNVSMFMAATAAQTSGSVDNGMWEAAFANTSNESEKQVLVERRAGELNATVTALREERQALLAGFRNGTIDRMTFKARMSTLVGELAALGDGIEAVSIRGEAVGVNVSRLEELRSQARELGGGEVSEIARTLAGRHGPPGQAGIFNGDGPGQAGEHGPADRSNRSTESNEPGASGDGNGSSDGSPPTDHGNGPSQGNATATPTESG